jgi:stress responsive alpha/beta barrel protein
VIDHVIAFKAPGLDPTQEKELFAKLGELRQVPGVREFALGRNFGERSRGFDVCMRITFETREDLDAYEAHPIHKDVVAYNRKVTEEHICFDFESM